MDSKLRKEVDAIYDMLGSFCAIAEMIRMSCDRISINTEKIYKACEEISEVRNEFDEIQAHSEKLKNLIQGLETLKEANKRGELIT